MVMALELIPASKRLLGNDTPQGNTELPKAWTIPSKHILDQVIIDRYGLVYHAFMRSKRNGLTIRLGPSFDSRECLGQGPMGLGLYPVH